MSHHKNNVNPNHYKEAGRMRPGDDVPHEQNKQKATRDQAMYRERASVKIAQDVQADESSQGAGGTNAADDQQATAYLDERA
jgi:hypothetical protein